MNIVWLVVSIPQKNMKVSWGYYSQYMEKCSKPPTMSFHGFFGSQCCQLAAGKPSGYQSDKRFLCYAWCRPLASSIMSSCNRCCWTAHLKMLLQLLFPWQAFQMRLQQESRRSVRSFLGFERFIVLVFYGIL